MLNWNWSSDGRKVSETLMACFTKQSMLLVLHKQFYNVSTFLICFQLPTTDLVAATKHSSCWWTNWCLLAFEVLCLLSCWPHSCPHWPPFSTRPLPSSPRTFTPESGSKPEIRKSLLPVNLFINSNESSQVPNDTLTKELFSRLKVHESTRNS